MAIFTVTQSIYALHDASDDDASSFMSFAASVTPARVGGDGGKGGRTGGVQGGLGGAGADGDSGGNGAWGSGGSGGGGGSSGGGAGGTGGSNSLAGASGGSGGGGGVPNGDPNGADGGGGGSGDGAVGGGGGGGGGGAHGSASSPSFNPGNGVIRGGDGGDGGSAASGYYYGGGGGGGGGGYGLTDAQHFTNIGAIRGGDGGNGGHGSDADGGGGQGGDGGVGAELSGASDNQGAITGGNGGQGGDGDSGGAGGQGGAGVVFNNGILQNTGVITGGNGGLRGSDNVSNTDDPGDAAGGAGLVGADVTVYNNGTISGGLNADGGRAAAVIFTAGASKLVLSANSVVTGVVRSEGADELALAGPGETFFLHHLGALDSGLPFQGFETVAVEALGVTGGTWRFEGAPAEIGVDFIVRGGATMDLAGNLFTDSDANGADPSNIAVQFAGKLTGGGAAYNVDVAANGVLAPGDGVGALKTAVLTLQNASTVQFELGATASDKLEVSELVFGTNGAGGAHLALSTVAGDRPMIGQVITLIENYTSAQTSGTFLGLADDAEGENNGVRFRISYDENVDGDTDNNDVTLTVLDLAPALLSASVNGATLVLTFDEALGGDGPDASLFTVSVAGASRAVTAVEVDGDKITLTLASAVSNGQAVTLSYSDFSSLDDGDVLEDATGLDAASFSGFAVTNTTPAPSDGGGGGAPSKPVTSEQGAAAIDAILGGIVTPGLAALQSKVASGEITFSQLVDALIVEAQSTIVPALVVSGFLGGAAPTEQHFEELAAFTQKQLEAYTAKNVLRPALGPYEALGLGFSETSSFKTKYDALDADDFIAKAYLDIFARAQTPAQHEHFEQQLIFFTSLYRAAGQSDEDSLLHAKGAVAGQMLGHAVLDERDQHRYDEGAETFLRLAAEGKANFGDPLAFV